MGSGGPWLRSGAARPSGAARLSGVAYAAALAGLRPRGLVVPGSGLAVATR